MGRTSVATHTSSNIAAADAPHTSVSQENPASPSRPSLLVRIATGVSHFVQAIANGWNHFWYEPRDPSVLGIIRWLVGGMLVYTHAVWGLDLAAFLGSGGWNSPEVLAVVQEDRIVPSFWWYVTDEWLLTVHCVCMTILVMFWVGLATRVTSVLSLCITISYAYRAHMANFGLDQINGILCFYLCLAPCGQVLSVDRFLAVWRAKRRAAAAGRPCVVPPVEPSVSANFAIRLMQFHFCVIYAFAGLSKLQGPAWWSGEAVWMAFANLEYQSYDMTWIAWYPWIGEVMTHATIIWEVSFPATVWVRPLRPWVLAIGFMMHFGIGAAMGLWTFAIIMIFGHACFWPNSAVKRFAGLFPSSEQLLGVNAPAPVTAVAPAVLPVTALPAASNHRRSSDRGNRKPALLCVDRGIRRRLSCVNYFLHRGFRCLSTDDAEEAHAVCDATAPDAVVVLGTQMQDGEIEVFHDTHCATQDHAPLFMFLTPDQSERLNGNIRTSKTHILTGQLSLGRLRREIQETLGMPEERTASRRTSVSPHASKTKS